MTSQRLIPTIQCWLLRSGDASISVKIEWDPHVFTTLEELDVVLAEFAQCSDRIERITFILPEYAFDDALFFLQMCHHKLHSLSMTLYRPEYYRDTLVSHSSALRTVLSKLQTQEFEGVWPPTFDAVERFPFLTKLKLSVDRYPASLAKFLEKCPSLEELHYEVYNAFSPQYFPHITHSPPILTLTPIRLLRLRVGSLLLKKIDDFIDCIRLPNLHRLEIDYRDPYPNDSHGDWPGLVRSLEASSSPLVELYLYNCSFSARAISACLRLLPGLKNLRCRVSKQVAKALNISGRIAGQPVLCPELQRMILETPILTSADAESLAAVLEEVVCSRCPLTTGPSACGSPGLRRRLELPNEFLLRTKFTDRLGIKDCIAQGLSIGAFGSGDEVY